MSGEIIASSRSLNLLLVLDDGFPRLPVDLAHGDSAGPVQLPGRVQAHVEDVGVPVTVVGVLALKVVVCNS